MNEMNDPGMTMLATLLVGVTLIVGQLYLFPVKLPLISVRRVNARSRDAYVPTSKIIGEAAILPQYRAAESNIIHLDWIPPINEVASRGWKRAGPS
jgi:hypothetical protein